MIKQTVVKLCRQNHGGSFVWILTSQIN